MTGEEQVVVAVIVGLVLLWVAIAVSTLVERGRKRRARRKQEAEEPLFPPRQWEKLPEPLTWVPTEKKEPEPVSVDLRAAAELVAEDEPGAAEFIVNALLNERRELYLEVPQHGDRSAWAAEIDTCTRLIAGLESGTLRIVGGRSRSENDEQS